ncbi:MAG TPA: CHAT domain-containing tetratricopeptide repeat protein, partial [Steroidobacteraceae bacterium]|nr:CHAT domain-containing tetratricopeptide repeat protein [Steroidobacteraceae bacterium]
MVLAAVLTCVLPASAQDTRPPASNPPDELRQLLARGQYADAEHRARDELTALMQGGAARSLRAAEVLDVLVVAMWRGGKASNDEAVAFAERAISLKEQLLGNEDPRLATSLDNAGVLFFVRGEYERARQNYQRALAVLSAAAAREPSHEAVGKVHSHLGPLYQELGQYSMAREHYEQALLAFLKAAPRDDQQIAMTQNNLATLMVKIGDYEAASTLYAQALTALEKRLGGEHPLIASGKHNVAELNQRMGRYPEAIELYKQAIALKEKTLGGKHPSLALSLSNLSYLYTDQPDIGPALELSARALQIQEAATGATHVDLAYSLISLGRAQSASGDTEDARRTLTRALELRSAALGTENPLLVPPLYFLGTTLVTGGKPREAFDVALRAETIGREHLRLTTRATPERQALRYSAERLPSLDLVLSIATRLQDPAITRSSWDALIRSRAVVLDEMAARHRLVTQENSTPLRKAFDDYRTAAESLSNVLLRGPTTNDLGRYQRSVADLRAGKEAAERALAAESETVRRGLAQQQIGFEEIRAALPTNTTLVAFARTRATAQQAASYLAFIAEPAQPPRIVSLGFAQPIETALRRWRDAMTPASAAAGKMPDPAAGEQLRQLLWDPLQVKPEGDRLVLIVPAGGIHLLNFAALPLANGRHLAEAEVLIHYLSSERDLIIDASAPRSDILVVGGASRGAAPRTAGCQPIAAADFPPLPGSLKEARRVAAIARDVDTPGSASVTELFGANATESAFKQQVRGKGLVHVAAHGFFQSSQCAESANPLRLSGLVFAAEGTNSKRPDDGLLLAEEVATLDFSAAQWV